MCSLAASSQVWTLGEEDEEQRTTELNGLGCPEGPPRTPAAQGQRGGMASSLSPEPQAPIFPGKKAKDAQVADSLLAAFPQPPAAVALPQRGHQSHTERKTLKAAAAAIHQAELSHHRLTRKS